ncbi:SIMPL domain-containing protein [Desulfopila aestuarii]|uniref:Uncharacterized conserved protein YggE, contains kinase-interacting SIMPL domain n=1 Tax=Desulfopila aestuarii DSM 18488 TaxID=1121416 RepID=A0A1M7YG98_9BACT|nr:SIMPL domain-containing protein [Desulfopila aestuarii]SHO51665.1 Uncharacterized conserved protein YggE, contains kinase-interacting SIMPL domain [Desulfopila aestuarii DSM 18488]
MRYTILAVTLLLLLPLNSFSKGDSRTILVNGTATITAKAELATIQTQLKVISPTVEESYAAVTQTLTDIAKAVQPLGIEKENLITSTIIQGTEYGWQNNTRTILGYYSACTLGIKIPQISDTFRVHAKLASFQNLMIGETEYGRNDEPQMRITALQQALQDAKAKAQAMAETLGTKLGEVHHIQEAEAMPFRPMSREVQLAAAPVDPGDVTTTGTISITGNVSVEFALQ